MNRLTTRSLLLCSALAIATEAQAQSVSDKALSDVEAVTAGTCSRLVINFNPRVQLISYFPQTQGRELHIRVNLLDTVLSNRESLRTPEGVPSLRSIAYEGDNTAGQVLSLYFTRDMQFSVKAGTSPNSIVVNIDEPGGLGLCLAATSVIDKEEATAKPVVDKTAPVATDIPIPPGLYVVNLVSKQGPIGDLSPEQTAALGGTITYESRFERDGQNWYRMRSGFFSTKEEAEAARSRLLQLFPDAWITRVTTDERREGVLTRKKLGDETLTTALNVPTGKAASAEDVAAVAKLKADAEQSIKAGENDRAIQLLTKALGYPETADTARVLELLGLTRERKGQAAHAQAEYEEYLRRFPEGEGADRVKQRLAALKTGSSVPTTVLRTPDEKTGRIGAQPWAWGVRGSFSQFYLRDQSSTRFIDATKPPTDPDAILALNDSVNLNQLLTNADVNISGGNDRTQLQLRAAGSYSKDFRPTGRDVKTLTALYVDFNDNEVGASVRLGRQTKNGSGILGRFDGAMLGYQASKKVKINFATGFPVLSSRQFNILRDRFFYGASVDIGAKRDKFQTTLYWFDQRTHGLVDRRALGLEARYFNQNFNAYTIVDYDVKFNKLNLGLITLNYTFPDTSSFSVSADYRQSPLLTTSNAIIGQVDPVTLEPIVTIPGLRQFFTDAQIYQLAQDRTLVAKSVTVNYSRPITKKLQANLDFSLTDTGGTPASGGVMAQPSTGKEYFYGAQLVGNGLLWDNDIFILGARYSDTQRARSYTADINARVPITQKLRISPRARYGFREDKVGIGTYSQIQPTVRVNYYPLKNSEVELEFGANFSRQYSQIGTSQNITKEKGFVLNLGYRLDF